MADTPTHSPSAPSQQPSQQPSKQPKQPSQPRNQESTKGASAREKIDDGNEAPDSREKSISKSPDPRSPLFKQVLDRSYGPFNSEDEEIERIKRDLMLRDAHKVSQQLNLFPAPAPQPRVPARRSSPWGPDLEPIGDDGCYKTPYKSPPIFGRPKLAETDRVHRQGGFPLRDPYMANPYTERAIPAPMRPLEENYRSPRMSWPFPPGSPQRPAPMVALAPQTPSWYDDLFMAASASANTYANEVRGRAFRRQQDEYFRALGAYSAWNTEPPAPATTVLVPTLTELPPEWRALSFCAKIRTWIHVLVLGAVVAMLWTWSLYRLFFDLVGMFVWVKLLRRR
ncbi:hypothetical protein Daus18300_002990 [Diaporthe australafricana]|uniref:Uncharacterized protein n=1 Tax=Diaporthe australafricana TaxID=127596 RepID=A0ABR3XIQ1_9PEZI